MTEPSAPPAQAPTADAATNPSFGLFTRILRFPLTLLILGIALWIGAATLASLIGARVPQGAADPMSLLVAAIAATIFLLIYHIFRTRIEGGPNLEFARSGAMLELGIGIAIGAGLFATVVGIAAALGLYRSTGVNSWTTIWPMLAMAVTSSVSEEILFRGMLLRLVERMTGSWIALILSSALFGFAHLINPNASLVAALAITIEAGVLLGAVYLLTRRLWAAIGLHAAWNFTQGWLFGLPVSGLDEPGLVVGRLNGPPLLTGGAFGLEASVIAIAIALAAGLVILVQAIRRGAMRPPRWMKHDRRPLA